MHRTSIVGALALTLVALPVAAQETPPSMVAAYQSLAKTVLAVRAAEADFVKSLLDGHFHAAKMLWGKQDWKGAAAQIALFANEGDNAIAGVRKMLLEGGHHFNAEEEEAGVYEPGYVIVTKAAKEKMLAASKALRQAETDEARQAAWKDFKAEAKALLGVE